MNTTAIFYANKIVREGDDKNGKYWCHCLAKEYGTDKGEGFVCLHLFGETAEYFSRNIIEPRRVLVSGEVTVNNYKEKISVTKKVKLASGNIINVPVVLEVEKNSVSIRVFSVKFLDQAIITEAELEVDSNEVVEECEVLDDDCEDEVTFEPVLEETVAATSATDIGTGDSFEFEKVTRADKSKRASNIDRRKAAAAARAKFYNSKK